MKPGAHAMTVLAYSAEGEGLKNAKVIFYDARENCQFAERTVAPDGQSLAVTADYNRPYQALVGYDGWTAHFEELEEDEDEPEEEFDPGELDEDRDIEHM